MDETISISKEDLVWLLAMVAGYIDDCNMGEEREAELKSISDKYGIQEKEWKEIFC